VQAHEADLRAEVERERLGRPATADEPADAASYAADIAAQGSEAAHGARLRALLQYAERLTLRPGSIEPAHIDALREVGLDDRAIHDAAQAVAYFAYINRVADGLGVDLEPDMA
jgi:uncharacterized peroxidase-related enzyme